MSRNALFRRSESYREDRHRMIAQEARKAGSRDRFLASQEISGGRWFAAVMNGSEGALTPKPFTAGVGFHMEDLEEARFCAEAQPRRWMGGRHSIRSCRPTTSTEPSRPRPSL